MKLRGPLLRKVQEQIAGGDPNPVAPDDVAFDENAWYALRANRVQIVGRARVERKDGRLWATADLYDIEVPMITRFAIGVGMGGGAARPYHLTEVILTQINTDRGMPLAVVVQDA